MDSPNRNSKPKIHPYPDHSKLNSKFISFGDSAESQDSGYTTNIEHDSVSMSAAASYSHALKRDCGDNCTPTLHLEPIVEGIEISNFPQSSAAELTPTTRNIAKINAFHITTPKWDTSPVHSSPLKQIGNTQQERISINNTSTRTTPIKLQEGDHTDGILSISPGRNAWQPRRPLRPKLNVDEDNVFALGENSTDMPIGIRPDNCGLLIAGVRQGNNKRKFTRNSSENAFQSSTPINFDVLKANTVTKDSNIELPRSYAARKDIRKGINFILSPSPSKHFQSLYGTKPDLRIVSDLPNPACKLLDFGEDKFDTILQPPPEKKLKRQNAIGSPNPSPARHTTTSAQYTNDSFNIGKIDVFHNEKTPPEFLNMSITPPQCDEMDLCSPIDNNCCVLATPTQDNTNSRYIIQNCSNNTDSARQLDLFFHTDIVPESPSTSQTLSTSIVDDTQRTPKKQSYGFPVFNSTPQHEQMAILYPTLQRTPPRNRCLKRLGNSPNSQRKPIRRKLCAQSLEDSKHIDTVGHLHEKLPVRQSFEGYEKLDIFKHLEDKLPAVDLVLERLSCQDLENVTEVSKRWRDIVNSSAVATRRLKHYRSGQSAGKENRGCLASVQLRSCDEKTKPRRAPLLRSNSSRLNLKSSQEPSVCVETWIPSNAQDDAFHERRKVRKIASYFVFVLVVCLIYSIFTF